MPTKPDPGEPAPPPEGGGWEIALKVAFGPAPEPILRSTPRERASSRYRLGEEIGRGGSGVVRHGVDAELDREIAVKLLGDSQLERPSMRERFEREARISGRLQHPGIVPVYDYGQREDGRPFIAMKLVEGRTLADSLAASARDPDATSRHLAVFEQVCHTLAYAHSRGVVHRDLKPANVMIGRFGEVQVVDWGLAKELAEEEDPAVAEEGPSPAHADAQLSELGTVMGTLPYTSPEQAQGRLREVGVASDLFSLGAILCEILTGAPPYRGRGRELLEQAAEARLDEARRRLTECGADPELIELARQCLDPDPRRRPVDSAELSRRLQSHRNGVERRQREAESAAREARAVAAHERRARRLTLALATVVVLAGGGGAALWWWQGVAEQRRVAKADAEVQPEHEQARRLELRASLDDRPERWQEAASAARRVWELAEAHEVSDELRQRAAALRERVERRAEEVERREREARRDREALARLEEVLDRWGIDDWPECEQAYERAFREYGLDPATLDDEEFLRRIRQRPIVVELAEHLFAWIRTRFLSGLYRDPANHEDLHRRIALLQAADPDPWRVEIRAAVIEGRSSRLLEMAARDEVRRLDERNLQFLTILLHDLGEPERAIEVLQRELYRFPASGLHAFLGLFLTEQQRWQEALRPLCVARGVDPSDLLVWTLIGRCHRHRGEWTAARRALEVAARLDPDHPAALRELAVLDERIGAREDALRRYQRARSGDPDDVSTQLLLAKALYRQGRTAEALDELRSAAATGRRLLSRSPDPRRVGDAERQVEEVAELAVRWRQRSLARELSDALVEREGGWVPLVHGRVLLELGHHEEALASLRRRHRLGADDETRAWIDEARAAIVLGDEPPFASSLASDADADECAQWARFLQRAGHPEEAARAWSRALELDPEVGGGPEGTARRAAAGAAIETEELAPETAETAEKPEPAGSWRERARRWLEEELERSLDDEGLVRAPARRELEAWEIDPRLRSAWDRPGAGGERWRELAERLRAALREAE